MKSQVIPSFDRYEVPADCNDFYLQKPLQSVESQAIPSLVYHKRIKYFVGLFTKVCYLHRGYPQNFRIFPQIVEYFSHILRFLQNICDQILN